MERLVVRAGFTDPELVLPEIVSDAACQRRPSRLMAGKQVSLLLDNFEHLIAAAPRLAPLLAASDGLRATATSRAPLRISGEHGVSA